MEDAAQTGPAERSRSGNLLPKTNRLEVADIVWALKRGLADFAAAPLFGLFFGAFFAGGGLLMLAALGILHKTWLIIPIAVGFPLIGPFVAVGLYDVSRRLEAGVTPRWRDVLTVMLNQRERQFGWMAFVVLFIFWVWMYQVRLLLALFLGSKAFSSPEALMHVLTTSPNGLTFLAVGTVIGAALSLVLFSVTVIAMPLLLEREVDFVTAMITSVKTVFLNPVVMLGWGLIVAATMFAAMLPLFLGVIIVLPVLGHATWHIYRRATAGI